MPASGGLALEHLALALPSLWTALCSVCTGGMPPEHQISSRSHACPVVAPTFKFWLCCWHLLPALMDSHKLSTRIDDAIAFIGPSRMITAQLCGTTDRCTIASRCCDCSRLELVCVLQTVVCVVQNSRLRVLCLDYML